MLFNSLTFAVFFVAVLAVLPRLTHRASNVFLLLASAVFYAAWDWRFLGLLIFSSGFNFWTSASMARSGAARARRRWFWLNVSVNLLVLVFFKYFNFFAANLNPFLLRLGFGSSIPVLDIILPLAISFYTFHCLSYSIDVYRGNLKPSESLLEFTLYLLLFPHLVAGPIVRASVLLPQIAQPRRTTQEDWREGLFLIFWGLAKKVVVADNLAPKADRLFQLDHASGGEVFLGVLAFTFQIYADFSGYTDMARGTARLMGFRFDLNFKFPYFATNPQDFWRRWHISLSQWLRDYLYIPLGGSRCGTLATYRNLFLTMLIGGLWHGAAWNFVLWGAYHGALICGHRGFRSWMGTNVCKTGNRGVSSVLTQTASILTMFAFTWYGWLLFRSTSFAQIADFTFALFQPAGWHPDVLVSELARQAVYFAPMLSVDLGLALRGQTTVVFRRDWANGLACCLLLYYVILLGSDGAESFIYFNV